MMILAYFLSAGSGRLSANPADSQNPILHSIILINHLWIQVIPHNGLRPGLYQSDPFFGIDPAAWAFQAGNAQGTGLILNAKGNLHLAIAAKKTLRAQQW